MCQIEVSFSLRLDGAGIALVQPALSLCELAGLLHLLFLCVINFFTVLLFLG